METIVLVIHLIIALAIIGLVLIQRSSGGGLGIGGGGGMCDFATARGTANTLTKMTTFLAFAFFITSLTLGWLATQRGETGILDSMEANRPQIQITTDAPDMSETPAMPADNVEPQVPTGE